MIDLFKVMMAPEAPELVSKVLMSGFIGQGPKVDEFEEKLKNHFNNDLVLTVNSCTSALQLAVHLIKKPNQHILLTPLTCFASAAAILANDVKIRWADVDLNNCNIDLQDVERKVNENTCGVMVVHWGGYPVDLDHLRSIQKRYQETYGKFLPIIEDCAHCWKSEYKGQLIGNSGNYCCFSFQAIKPLTTADGGLLITPDAESYRQGKLLRWFGLDRDQGSSFRCVQDIKTSGFKYHMNDVSAAIGLANLPYMDETVGKCQDNCAFYQEALKNVSGVTLLENLPDRQTSGWLYTIRVEDRVNFMKTMQENEIATSPVHARCDSHTCVAPYRSLLPNMNILEKDMVVIPSGWWVSKEDREYIVECIKNGW
jgi:dTDP-4-amino-4,6-dideoxy-D-glucose/dTDP-4-amino-2,4-dideoxy-beta-L-xylose transaminase